ncbi:uncharacterized protein LOC129870307 [Solanum dulcamara]|uniref:uncharacterized protein LOC129870307 n=1 Tax=Solanum dulcamara TaxID=45834 RepID=UPI00248666F8|nr:uncharacterized protein LOC129870307 [Solanum dulcamara]
MDPLKYIFQKPMPIGKLTKWQILLSEFNIVYVTQKAIKGQALADHLAENPVEQDYEPLKTYFSDEEVLFVGENVSERYDGWRIFFDGASNSKGVGIGAVLISEKGQYYPISAKIRFDCTNNMAEYEACILGLKMSIDMNVKELLVIGDSDLLVHQVLGEWATKNVKILPYLHYIKELSRKFTSIEFKHVPRAQNEFVDALAIISSMIQHPDKNYIDPIEVKLHDRHAYCFHVVEEMDGRPWYYDIKRLIDAHEYPENATIKLKRTLRRMSNHFFLNGEILYRRTLDLGLLRCVDAKEAMRLLEEIHGGTCGPHMNGFTLAKKILRAGYFWMTMERDSIRYVQKCHQCQVHGDFIRVAPNELNVMGSPWLFSAWGMDVEASTYKAVTKKVVADFVRNNIICRFGIPESIITDNAANLNSDLMKEIYERFKITHRNSTTYWPQMNGAVEAANKNIKKILRKIVDEAVIPAEVEIPSLRIIQEVSLDDVEWIRNRIEQLMLIDEKRMDAVCHGQLYQNRMAKAFNKKVKPRQFTPGQLVLKKIFPHQGEARGNLHQTGKVLTWFIEYYPEEQ